ncbi:hypothetical protein JW933_02050 [candidate division FCPU426 bacterium]|nr:hypothetical protein [candidate division FCPU426 bacterium]
MDVKVLRRFSGHAHWTWLGLLMIMIMAAVLRWHSWQEPLERDLATYAYIGHRLLAGEQLYTQWVDIKAPAIYFTYMLAEAAWGYNEAAVVWSGIVAVWVSMLFLFLVARRAGGALTALASCVLFMAASTSYRLQANLPNTETFINAFILAGLWAFLASRLGKRSRIGLWCGSLCFALATLYKVQAFLIPAGLTCYLAAFFLWRRSKNCHAFLHAAAALWLPSFLWWGGIFGYYWVTGRFEDFWNVFYHVGRSYAGSILTNEMHYFTHLRLLWPQAAWDITPLYIWGLLALVILKKPGKRRGPGLFFWYGLGSFLMVGVTPRFFPHYYQLLIPCLCLVSALTMKRAAWLLARKRPGTQAVDGHWANARNSMPQPKGLTDKKPSPCHLASYWVLAGLIFIGSSIFMLLPVLRYLQLHPAEISSAKYGRDNFGRVKEIGLRLRKTTRPEETLFQWGIDPGFYFYSRRKAASGVLSLHTMKYSPPLLRKKYLDRIYTEVTMAAPAVFIYNRKFGRLEDNVFYDFLRTGYMLQYSTGPYLIFKRRPEGQQ